MYASVRRALVRRLRQLDDVDRSMNGHQRTCTATQAGDLKQVRNLLFRAAHGNRSNCSPGIKDMWTRFDSL